jgi:myosin-5
MAPESDVHTVGTRVWVKDEVESWKKGDVLKLDGENLVITIDGGKHISCKADDAPIQNPDTRGGVEVKTLGGNVAKL